MTLIDYVKHIRRHRDIRERRYNHFRHNPAIRALNAAGRPCNWYNRTYRTAKGPTVTPVRGRLALEPEKSLQPKPGPSERRFALRPA